MLSPSELLICLKDVIFLRMRLEWLHVRKELVAVGEG